MSFHCVCVCVYPVIDWPHSVTGAPGTLRRHRTQAVWRHCGGWAQQPITAAAFQLPGEVIVVIIAADRLLINLHKAVLNESNFSSFCLSCHRATCQLIPVQFFWTPCLQWPSSSTALPPTGLWASCTTHSEVSCGFTVLHCCVLCMLTSVFLLFFSTDWRICSPPYLEIHSTSDLSSIQQAVMAQGLSFPLSQFTPAAAFLTHS